MAATVERILLIENDPSFFNSIQGILHSHLQWTHCFVEHTGSVRAALKELSIKEYQLILVDCPSFDNSPLEVVIQIRGAARDTPLILINKAGMERTAIHCLKNGADHYLIKDKVWEIDIPTIISSVLEEYKQKRGFKKRLLQLEEENKRLKNHAVLDELTLFYSSEHFSSLMSREVKRAARHGLSLTCVILDVNMHEHLIRSLGEKSLDPLYEKLALLLKSFVRSSDIWARLDKNRFAALFPHTTAKEGKKAITRINCELTDAKFNLENKEISLTALWGLADFNKDKIKDEEELLAHAESNLKSWDPHLQTH